MNTELAKGIDWVGFVDWNVRDFHSFDTFHGATYNSFLIQDEKTAVIDSVKAPYVSRQIERIAEKVPLAKVDYLVCNHAEPDHAGGIASLLEHLPNAQLLCNAKCKDSLEAYFKNTAEKWNVRVITPEDTVSLGKRTLKFINTPMVHWPESMFTYVPEEQILFSMDAFGQHIATSERFDDQYDLSAILREAKSYYANIVTPYGKQVQSVLKAAAGLPIKVIAASHGLMWRKHPQVILEQYQKWAAGTQQPKILVMYDSMWDSTSQMAQTIYEGAISVSNQLDVQLIHIRRNNLTNIATEMLDAAGVALGSPTLNMQMMPHLSSVLTYIKGLKFSPKAAFAFGSYGWASAGVEQIDKWIDETGWNKTEELIKCRFRPDTDVLKLCFDAGVKLAGTVLP
ncbi:MBL fold metallo-hydrolase [Planctomycetales bacterium]|nr:MBL fold metallo-hydrolase [Planctomycetales bacterium]